MVVSKMDQLIKTLPAILAASGDAEDVAEAACIAAWKHAVGEALSSHAVPVQLRDRVLVIAVADSIWQKQLHQMRSQLLFRLNSVLGKSLVASIELRVDPNVLAKSRPRESARRESNDYAVPFELLAAASEIEDAGLRRAFLGAATSCTKRIENTKPPGPIRNPKF